VSGGHTSVRFALCNEAFGKHYGARAGAPGQWSWAQTVREIAVAGYDGVEIAPFTLADSVVDLTPADRRAIRRQAEDVGLEIVGLHWLFVSPQGLHATTSDRAVRQRTAEYLQELVRFCGDVGGRVMVVGSPQQRNVEPGVPYAVAWERFVEMIGAALDLAAERGVTLCMEALPADQCNFVTSLDEAVRMVREVNHPNLRAMFDVHNAHLESEPLPELLRRYLPYVRHVHLNEMDGGYPGAGDFDFGSILRVLREESYEGYASVEVFDFSPGPQRIARESLHHLASASHL
jgi:D-psicose/D-tagatose/L-ribulose 3-epimerase